MTVQAPVRLWLPGRGRPWQRTRGQGSHRYNAADYVAWRDEVAWRMRAEVAEPMPGEVAVVIELYEDATALTVSPSSRSRPTGQRADIDNIAKSILDAGNKILYSDDRKVSILNVQFNATRRPV